MYILIAYRTPFKHHRNHVLQCAFHQESVACFHLSTMGDNTMTVQLKMLRGDLGVPRLLIFPGMENGNTVTVSGVFVVSFN